MLATKIDAVPNGEVLVSRAMRHRALGCIHAVSDELEGLAGRLDDLAVAGEETSAELGTCVEFA